jgi:hypothetical protein
MLDPMEVAECVVDYAQMHGKLVRLYMTPSNNVLLMLPGEHSKRIFYSALVGVYSKECPPIYIVQDIIDEMVAKQNLWMAINDERRRGSRAPVPPVGGNRSGTGPR